MKSNVEMIEMIKARIEELKNQHSMESNMYSLAKKDEIKEQWRLQCVASDANIVELERLLKNLNN